MNDKPQESVDNIQKKITPLVAEEASSAPNEADDKTTSGIRAADSKAKSKSAGVRADDLEAHLFREMKERISKLQDKLDQREDELSVAIPKLAMLEEFERTFKFLNVFFAVSISASGILLAVSSYIKLAPFKGVLFGGGIAFAIMATAYQLWSGLRSR